MIHELKIRPEFFEACTSGNKTFEVRQFDRPFEIGDYLALNERRDLYRAMRIVQYYIHFVRYGILQAWLCNPIHRALCNKPGWPHDTGIHQGGHAMKNVIFRGCGCGQSVG